MNSYTTLSRVKPIRVVTQEAIKTNLSLELEKQDVIVDASVNIYVISLTAQEKSVKANLKAVYNVVYKTDDGLNCFESGAEFSVAFNHEQITSKTCIFPEIAVSKVTVDRNEESVAISALIDCEATFNASETQEVLLDVEGAVCKKEQKERIEYFLSGENFFEVEGEKILPFNLKKVLSHKHVVLIKETQCGIDEVISDGEILSEFLLLTNSNDLRYETLTTNFRLESELNGVTPESVAISQAVLENASLKVVSEEESGKSSVGLTFGLKIFCDAYEKKQAEYIQDAFFVNNESILESEQILLQCALLQEEKSRKFFGEAIFEKEKDEKYLCPISSNIYAVDYSVQNNKLEVSMVVKAKVLTELNGEKFSREAEIPLNFSVDVADSVIAVNPIKKSLSVKQSDGKCFLEGEINLIITTCENYKINVLVKAEKGQEKQTDNSTIGIIFIQAGDDEWTVCKKVGVNGQTLMAQNPDLLLPAESDCAVVVFRQSNS